MKWYKRYLIKDRIKLHMRKREICLYQRNQLWDHDKYYNDLWDEAGRQLRCAERMTKLLEQY